MNMFLVFKRLSTPCWNARFYLLIQYYLEEIDNQITLQSFRLIIKDAIQLFNLLNEAVILILANYFFMVKSDATVALSVYKAFVRSTEKFLDLFEVGRKLRARIGIDVPVFKYVS